MIKVSLGFLAALAGFSTLSAGVTYEYPGSDPFLEITFPDDWTVEAEDQIISIAEARDLGIMPLASVPAAAP